MYHKSQTRAIIMCVPRVSEYHVIDRSLLCTIHVTPRCVYPPPSLLKNDESAMTVNIAPKGPQGAVTRIAAIDRHSTTRPGSPTAHT